MLEIFLRNDTIERDHIANPWKVLRPVRLVDVWNLHYIKKGVFNVGVFYSHDEALTLLGAGVTHCLRQADISADLLNAFFNSRRNLLDLDFTLKNDDTLVSHKGQVKLTKTQFAMLTALAESQDPVSQYHLCKVSKTSDTSIKVHLAHIRAKLIAAGSKVGIVPMRGKAQYRLDVPKNDV